MYRLISKGNRQVTWLFMAVVLIAALALIPKHSVQAGAPSPSDTRSAFGAFSAALTEYQLKHDQRFPREVAELDPYLNEYWRTSEQAKTILYTSRFAGRSLKEIPVEELEHAVFLQTAKAANGRYYARCFDGRIEELDETNFRKVLASFTDK